jgi:quercetin dioxygenase-like cupin family protein
VRDEELSMAKVREFVTSWEPTNFVFWAEREARSTAGTAAGRRNVPLVRPFDMLGGPNESVAVLSNQDARVDVESLLGPAPYFRRNIDFDELIFQFAGTSVVESEMGKDDLGPGEMLFIPRGIAHRSIGAGGCLRMTVRLHEPVEHVMAEDVCVTETTFDVKRQGGPPAGDAGSAAVANGGSVREIMFLWDESPADATSVQRDYSDIVGVGSVTRDTKVSAIKKLRPFDLFEGITGRKGPGPKFLSSSACIMEVYNTIGDQFAFHRALGSEEFGLQFMGKADNVSEYDALLATASGDLALIPLGIAHRVQNCTADFRRLVIYSKYRFNLLVDPSMHVVESRFDVTETVTKAAPWHDEARRAAEGVA